MNPKYQLVFTYASNPLRVEIPFVTYKPKQAIFSFSKVLSPEEKTKMFKIAEMINVTTLPFQVEEKNLKS